MERLAYLRTYVNVGEVDFVPTFVANKYTNLQVLVWLIDNGSCTKCTMCLLIDSDLPSEGGYWSTFLENPLSPLAVL